MLPCIQDNMPDAGQIGASKFDGYTLALPDVTWSYETTSGAFNCSCLMYRVMRAWSFAHRYGFRVHDVMYHGRALNARQIERINLWIQGGGAAEAQKLEHWEAVRLFERIIEGVAE